jgi:serine/threonine protein kinase/tetratricopeptide (TPR) repeat protein
VIETRQILEEVQLQNVLATSSTGAVFLGRDPDTGQDAVIKLVSCAIPNAEDQVRNRFLEMVDAVGGAEPRAMPPILDHGLTPEGDGFVVMEQIEGQTLDAIDEVEPEAAMSILMDVLACIEDLAQAGIAHLNLKPGNILITNQPTNDRASVLGFGTSAAVLYAPSGEPIPANDPHLAPELVAGNVLPPDQAWRSDLFSFGVIACGLLGAEIEADGYERPRIALPAGVWQALGEVAPLEKALGQVMEPDPMRRGSSPSDLRDPLIRALPEGPPPIQNVETAVIETSKAGAFDPNRTDPAFDPVEAAQTEIEAPDGDTVLASEPVSTEEEPVDTVLNVEPPREVAPPVVAEDGDPGWPELFFDDMEVPECFDEADDTDVGDPVPGDIWVPKIDEVEVAEETPVAVAPSAETTTTKRRVPTWELALVSAMVVILASIIALTWPRGAENQELSAASLTETELVPDREPLVAPTDDNRFDDLLAIQQQVEAGDIEGAREALNVLDQRQGESFTSDEAALYQSLVTALNQVADRESAIADLRGGLDHGSVRMLRRGVAGLSGVSRHEIEEHGGLVDDLAQARMALRLHGEMWEAERQGNHVAAIERADRLINVLPGYSGAFEVRNDSASELEAQAEGLISDHRYDGAVTVLESLLEVWPNRDGAADRITWCRAQIAASERSESAIAAALAAGDAGDPEAGIAMLDAMDPKPRYQGEYDRARKTLEARLAELDANGPVLQIASSEEFAFKKNQTVTVPIKVTDDYRVERVVVHARNEADEGYLEIPLKAAANGLYHFLVTPDLHGNKNVYFYVVAEDGSGHTGYLGASDAPHKVERIRWLKKILK